VMLSRTRSWPKDGVCAATPHMILSGLSNRVRVYDPCPTSVRSETLRPAESPNHHIEVLPLTLTEPEKVDLLEFLQSL
jgi:hypothetical protein